MDRAAAGLARHLAEGGGLLGIRWSSTSLTGMRQWPEILGGRWIRGRSMHPPRDECVVSVTDAEHPITAGLDDFTIVDERYSHLETQPDVTVLYEHRFEGRTHPLVWARTAGQAGWSTTPWDTRSGRTTRRVTSPPRAVREVADRGPLRPPAGGPRYQIVSWRRCAHYTRLSSGNTRVSFCRRPATPVARVLPVTSAF